MRGADAGLDEDIEVGFDAGFERHWHKAETVGHGIMALFVVAGLAGLLGRGPFSHRTVVAADHALSVDYEPMARVGTGTQVTLHLSGLAGGRIRAPAPPGTVAVGLSFDSAVVDPMGLQGLYPNPAESVPGQGSIDYVFDVAEGEPDALVRLMFKPTQVGPVHLWVRQNGGPAVAWTQWVLP